jgi:hypothetical protein
MVCEIVRFTKFEDLEGNDLINLFYVEKDISLIGSPGCLLPSDRLNPMVAYNSPAGNEFPASKCLGGVTHIRKWSALQIFRPTSPCFLCLHWLDLNIDMQLNSAIGSASRRPGILHLSWCNHCQVGR